MSGTQISRFSYQAGGVVLRIVALFKEVDDIGSTFHRLKNLDFPQNFTVSDRFQNLDDYSFPRIRVYSFVHIWILSPSQLADQLDIPLMPIKGQIYIPVWSCINIMTGKLTALGDWRNLFSIFQFPTVNFENLIFGYLPPVWLVILIVVVFWAFIETGSFVWYVVSWVHFWFLVEFW